MVKGRVIQALQLKEPGELANGRGLSALFVQQLRNVEDVMDPGEDGEDKDACVNRGEIVAGTGRHAGAEHDGGYRQDLYCGV